MLDELSGCWPQLQFHTTNMRLLLTHSSNVEPQSKQAGLSQNPRSFLKWDGDEQLIIATEAGGHV